MNDFISGLAGLFEQAYLQGVEEGRKRPLVEPEMMDRKEVCAKVLHVAPDTGDKYYLYRPGFPFTMQGNQRKYFAPAVYEWLLNNQELTTK